jgi:hypothetical protein
VGKADLQDLTVRLVMMVLSELQVFLGKADLQDLTDLQEQTVPLGLLV